MGYDVYYQGIIGIEPKLSPEHIALSNDFFNNKRTPETTPIFEEIANQKLEWNPDNTYSGLLEVSADSNSICPEDCDNRHGLDLWLEWACKFILTPLGYTASGEIYYDGEENDDRGRISVGNGNQVEIFEATVVYQGPSWASVPHMDKACKEAIQQVLSSADNSGCSPDLTVVSAEAIAALQNLATTACII